LNIKALHVQKKEKNGVRGTPYSCQPPRKTQTQGSTAWRYAGVQPFGATQKSRRSLVKINEGSPINLFASRDIRF
jgi:hypothetical protein